MAAEGPLKELCEEASCSICLDFFNDPVTIAECGHNFCRACLTRSWGESGAAEPSCPQCRGKAREGSLRPNQQLANVVEIIKKLSPLEEKGAEAKGGEGKGGVCEKHREPLELFCKDDEAPLCVVCGRSQEHRGHRVTPLEEVAAREKKAVVAAIRERVCQKHQEPLKLFCKDDEAPICVVCEQSQEHKYHNIVPVEEASQEYKAQFCTCVEILRKERNKILAYKVSIVKESQDLLKQTKGERQKTVTKFKQLHMFLYKQEKLLLAQMEEVEKEVARNRDQHLAEISEELSSLESLIREMEEKSQQPAGDLLQDARSTLQKYEEKEAFENPMAFSLALKWRIWDFSDVSPLLEGIKKHLKDTLDSGLHPQKAKLTLDLDTAHPKLVLSADQKTMREGEKAQDLPNSPERFDNWGIVLGREGFTGGRHFWEVLVGSEEDWAVGVARKSVRRKEQITFRPKDGIWKLGKWGGSYRPQIENDVLPLPGELKRIQVSLNYAGGRVAFFDADRAALLYEVSGASFSGETLLPFFWVRSKGQLTISS
ncbi:PREDICTED: tripartite motif-containing protein 7-like [Gekko japonicus]|uniref:Tripartite motif-containing protein 7-like n=1 Tax=Gekko japonicus TaxID=146911 RepID=A0ABM1LCH9_GEKJA|nr:PREDICTED: tripartite motif-containing protein 7-like [Gekko japonicus]